MFKGASAAARLRLALDLFTTGESLTRQRLRRLHPEWTADEIEEKVAAWLLERPGAEAGDAEGVPVAWKSRGE
jgi:hypothetical protein